MKAFLASSASLRWRLFGSDGRAALLVALPAAVLMAAAPGRSEPVAPAVSGTAVPQPSVECLGTHALCNATTDCRRTGPGTANCSCWRVKEPHVVQTDKIQDTKAREATRKRCTTATPCSVDEAPICRVIRAGTYTVDQVTFPAVSTFSYRGWCQTFRPVKCAGALAGPWADCMGAPCEVDPKNPDRPLKCRCRVTTSDFVGIDGRCDSRQGEVMSTIPLNFWNFDAGTFAVPVPGNAFVNQGACRFPRSDP
ncbi:MAG: hypothetical protein ACK587_12705 [Cyanobacteriota bacterium]